MFSEDNKIIVRGRNDLLDEKDQLVDVIEDIGELTESEINPVKLSSWQPSEIDENFNDFYDELRSQEELESSYRHKQGGLKGRDLTTAFLMYPLHNQLEGVPVMHVTDQPIFVEETETGQRHHVYGLTKTENYNSAAVLSTFAFQYMDSEGRKEMFDTLSYHEVGHVLSPVDYDREYLDENRFGGGHCPNYDVMTDKGIIENAVYRDKNQVYCDKCLEEIKTGIEDL